MNASSGEYGPHVRWHTDSIGIRFPRRLRQGEWAAWSFGLLNAYRAIDHQGVAHQGITITRWGACRKGRRAARGGR